MFKRDNLPSRFRTFLTGCRSFATIKNLVTLLVTDLTCSANVFTFADVFVFRFYPEKVKVQISLSLKKN